MEAAGEGSLGKGHQEQRLADDKGIITYTRRRRPLHHPRRRLPQELIESILRRTSLWASARLQLVSKTWAAASRGAMASHRTPWIFVSEYDVRTSWSAKNYMVSIGGDGALFEVKLACGAMFLGACDGWLALIKRGCALPVLVNPFTMSQICSPCFLRSRGNYKLRATVKSSHGCCMVASVRDHVALWHPGQDEWRWWTIDGWQDKHVISIGALNEEFYVLDGRDWSVYVADFLSGTLTPLEAPGLPPRPAGSDHHAHLVESQGDLFLVHCTPARLKGVYRLDLSKKEWVVVKSLGKHRALFVGPSTWWSCPFSVSVEQAVGCRGDCVYLLEAGTGARWRVFDMADGVHRTFESPPRSLISTQGIHVAWVLPSLG